MERLPTDEPMDNTVPLSELKPGQRGVIRNVGGERAIRRRYLEMGFVRGETVIVNRAAPLGDPIHYTVKGYNISLRLNDANQILVSVVDGQCDG